MNTNLNQLLKDLEIGPAYVKILICLLGCTFMLYPTFFTSPVFPGTSCIRTGTFHIGQFRFVYGGRNSSFSDKSGEVSKDTLYPFGDAFLFSNDKYFHLFIFLNEECNRFKLFSTVLSVMYLLQFIAGGISILKEKKGEKDNAHY